MREYVALATALLAVVGSAVLLSQVYRERRLLKEEQKRIGEKQSFEEEKEEEDDEEKNDHAEEGDDFPAFLMPTLSSDNLNVFTGAVGGHSSKNKGPAMLQGPGVILKAFQGASKGLTGDEKADKRQLRGEMEAAFYALVHATHHPLRHHQPRFFGVQELSDGTKYLVLEDLTYQMSQPCVLDLKMGRRSYDEDATPEKIEKERAKYPPQEVVGFRFSGMRVYQPATCDWVISTREWCFSLEPAQIPDALERFFFDGRSVRRPLIRMLVDQIGAIVKCLENYPKWRMYGASLLIIYDGGSARNIVKAKLIDFSHCYEIKDKDGKDYGFLHGLYYLLGALNDILDRGRMNLTRRNSLVDSAARLIVQSSERNIDSAETSSTRLLMQNLEKTQDSEVDMGSAAPISPSIAMAAYESSSIGTAAPSETLEMLQQDPHLAPVVRRKLGTGVDEDGKRAKSRRSTSMHDVLIQSARLMSDLSPKSLAHHQRSPSSNAVFSGSNSPSTFGPSELPSAPENVRTRSVDTAFTESSSKSSPSGNFGPAEEVSPIRSMLLNHLDLGVQQEVDDVILESPVAAAAITGSRDLESGFSSIEAQHEPVKTQVGGSHDNVFVANGLIQKEEVDREHFDAEVQFYMSIANDSLNRITPAFIRVDDTSQPRRIVLEDVTSLVAQPIPAAAAMENGDTENGSRRLSQDKVNIMDVKLGFRSFRPDVSNEAKKSYFEKYQECIGDLDSIICQNTWMRIMGDPSGPATLKNGLLGKRDYLLFRDGTTTSFENGFRLTALKHVSFSVSQEEAKTKVTNYTEFIAVFEKFLSSGTSGFDSELAANFITEIDSILEAITQSEIFDRSELIGTSLLFVHQGGIPAVRWIDFANVCTPPSEDRNGIVYGIKNLRKSLERLLRGPLLDI